MAMGIVSDADFLADLNRYDVSVEELDNVVVNNDSIEPIARVEQSETKGRPLEKTETPTVVRNLIASTAIESGRQAAIDLAKQFSISPSSVSAYTNGATSTATYNKPDPELKRTVDSTKKNIADQAKGRLLSALDNITDEKLSSARLRDIAQVAQAMSAVVRNMESPEEDSNKPTVNVVFFSPRIKSEDSFEVQELNE